jgi:hypothetical protein
MFNCQRLDLKGRTKRSKRDIHLQNPSLTQATLAEFYGEISWLGKTLSPRWLEIQV